MQVGDVLRQVRRTRVAAEVVNCATEAIGEHVVRNEAEIDHRGDIGQVVVVEPFELADDDVDDVENASSKCFSEPQRASKCQLGGQARNGIPLRTISM